MASEKPETLVYLNGRLLPYSEAVVAMKDGGFESAGGFYDGERTFDGRLFKLRQHLQRLYNGLNYSKIDPGMSLDEMERITLDLLERNLPRLEAGHEFAVSQVVSVISDTSNESNQKVNVVIYCQPIDFSQFAQSYLRGVRIVTPPTYGVQPQGAASDPRSGGQSVLPLMWDAEGNVTECKGGNFMFASGGRIKLPHRRNVLPGVSMQTVLEIAESADIPVDEDDYPMSAVYAADEAFVSSTRFCLVPVDTVNGMRLHGELPGPVTRKLTNHWSKLVGLDFVQQALDHATGGPGEAATTAP